MSKRKTNITLLTFLMLCVISKAIYAQDNFTPQVLRLYEDNDFINLRGEGTDRDYTNGTRIDMFYTKSAKRRFLTSLLIPLNNSSDNLYGIGITQLMFTPSDLSRSDVIVGDLPYAGLLFLNHTLISSDDIGKQKLTTEINLGVIGPASLAEQAQTELHKLIGSQKPMGWGNQVKNDAIINYKIQYEKLLVSPSDKFEMIGLIEADAGTLYNLITTGLTFRAGKYGSYFSNHEKPGVKTNSDKVNNKRFQFYFYMKPMLSAFMDDSALQGGEITGRTSVYTIPADSLTRFYMQFEYGFVFGFKRMGLSVNEKLRTSQFKNEPDLQAGNITLYIGL